MTVPDRSYYERQAPVHSAACLPILTPDHLRLEWSLVIGTLTRNDDMMFRILLTTCLLVLAFPNASARAEQKTPDKPKGCPSRTWHSRSQDTP